MNIKREVRINCDEDRRKNDVAKTRMPQRLERVASPQSRVQKVKYRKWEFKLHYTSEIVPNQYSIRQHNPNSEQHIFQKMSTGFKYLIDRSQIQVLSASTFYSKHDELSKEWNGATNIGKRGKLLVAADKQLSVQVHNVIDYRHNTTQERE